jgi:flagella basal body P-ring formation protein FlgA
MRSTLFLVLLLALCLEAATLKPLYLFTDHQISSRDIDADAVSEFEILQIPDHKTKLKVPASKIIQRFEAHGLTLDRGTIRRVTFIKRSPVDLGDFEQAVRELFEKHYPGLIIHRLTVYPRSYTEVLPKSYTFELDDRLAQRSEGTFYIRTDSNRKYFFDFAIDATVDVLVAKTNLERDTELTHFNTYQKAVHIDDLEGQALTRLEAGQYQIKYALKANEPITFRDLESAPLVKRGRQVMVSMKNGMVLIEFSATALEDGGLHDIIALRKADGQKVKARVTGMNKVELR